MPSLVCQPSIALWTRHSPAVPNAGTVTLPVFPDLKPGENSGLDLYHVYPLLRMGIYPDRIRERTRLRARQIAGPERR